MAQINPEQLGRHLSSGLRPIYWISGDEPLLVQEAADAIRNAARQQGFSEREVHHTNAQFQWPQILQSANSMSLFAEKKLIEVRVHAIKIGDAGSKVLQEYCSRPNDDTLLLLISPKLDRPTQNTAWYKQVDQQGVVVTVWPIKEQQLPRWIEHRVKQAGLKADSAALDILTHKIEGNLLAAIQEIEKLKLLAYDGIIDAQMMASAVMDSARYDVFGLMDKTLSGNARTAVACLNGLKSEGTEPIVVLWAFSREIRTLLALKRAHAQGQSIDSQARNHGIFPQRLPLIKAALARLNTPQLEHLLKLCAVVDRCVKGMDKQNPWDTLLDILLGLTGQPTVLSALNP